jgi:hypothetical protein
MLQLLMLTKASDHVSNNQAYAAAKATIALAEPQLF